MSLIQQLTQQISGEALKGLSQQLGADEGTTGKAITAALPMIIGALARNSASEEGAQSLDNALANDHDGSILNNLAGFLSSTDNGPGAGILRHVFGEKRPHAEQGISQLSGLDGGKAGALLENLAPIVMGMLGQQKQQQGLNASALAGLLGNEVSNAQSGTGSMAMNLLSNFLDQDGDGSMVDDVMGMIGKFMRKK